MSNSLFLLRLLRQTVVKETTERRKTDEEVTKATPKEVLVQPTDAWNAIDHVREGPHLFVTKDFELRVIGMGTVQETKFVDEDRTQGIGVNPRELSQIHHAIDNATAGGAVSVQFHIQLKGIEGKVEHVVKA